MKNKWKLLGLSTVLALDLISGVKRRRNFTMPSVKSIEHKMEKQELPEITEELIKMVREDVVLDYFPCNYHYVGDIPEFYQQQLQDYDKDTPLEDIVYLCLELNDSYDLSWIQKTSVHHLTLQITEPISKYRMDCFSNLDQLESLRVECLKKLKFSSEEEREKYKKEHSFCYDFSFGELCQTYDVDLTNRMFSFVKSCPQLTEISLLGCHLKESQELDWLLKNQNLESVYLLKSVDRQNMMEDILEQLSHFNNFGLGIEDKLRIEKCETCINIHSDGLDFNFVKSYLPTLKNIETINLCNCSNYEDAQLEADFVDEMVEFMEQNQWLFFYYYGANFHYNSTDNQVFHYSFDVDILPKHTERIYLSDSQIYHFSIFYTEEKFESLKKNYSIIMDEDTEKKFHEINQKLDEMVQMLNIDETMSDQQKLDEILYFIAQKYQYDFEYKTKRVPPLLETPFKSDKIICSNYAALVSALATRLGLKCYYLFSDIHAWNLIRIGEDYFYTDLTWVDDPKDLFVHDFKNGVDENLATLKYEWYLKDPNNVVDEAHQVDERIKFPEVKSKKYQFLMYLRDHKDFQNVLKILHNLYPTIATEVLFLFALQIFSSRKLKPKEEFFSRKRIKD